jgi:hypothetical protein
MILIFLYRAIDEVQEIETYYVPSSSRTFRNNFLLCLNMTLNVGDCYVADLYERIQAVHEFNGITGQNT